MARTAKQGLEYFPFDVDTFWDLRIRKLIKAQGGKAFTVYALLLCLIYRDGYYIRWDEELPFIISERTGYDEAYIREVIQCCLNLGLFSKEHCKAYGILTSKGIQERYTTINRLCKRVATITDYNLLPGIPQVRTVTTRRPHKSTSARLEEPPASSVQSCSLTLDEEIAALKAEEAWLDQLQILHRMDINALRAKLDEFRLHCHADGRPCHDNLSDAKQHFNNWLRIVATKQNSNANNRSEQKNQRRGNLLAADEEKTYGGTF